MEFFCEKLCVTPTLHWVLSITENCRSLPSPLKPYIHIPLAQSLITISIDTIQIISGLIFTRQKPNKNMDAMHVHLSWLVCEVCLLGILWSVLVMSPALTLDYCWHFTTDGCVQRHCWDLMCSVTKGNWEILAALILKKKIKLNNMTANNIFSGTHSFSELTQ